MSKAVLISIRPKWCEKIANGEKTIEVRKTRPKLNTPVKCYIYCTKDSAKQFWTGPRYSYTDDHSHNAFDRRGDGKVIGEFLCSDIIELPAGAAIPPILASLACMPAKAMHDYFGNKTGYGWFIEHLRLYDKPLELGNFRRHCKNEWWCESCAMYREQCGVCGNESLLLRRAPQSWGYVEELK